MTPVIDRFRNSDLMESRVEEKQTDEGLFFFVYLRDLDSGRDLPASYRFDYTDFLGAIGKARELVGLPFRFE